MQSKSLANPFYSNKFRVNEKSESPTERNLGTPPRKDWKKLTDETVPAFGGFGQAEAREESKQKQSSSLSPTRASEYIQREEYTMNQNSGPFAQSSPAFGLYPTFGGLNGSTHEKRLSQLNQQEESRKLYPNVIPEEPAEQLSPTFAAKRGLL